MILLYIAAGLAFILFWTAAAFALLWGAALKREKTQAETITALETRVAERSGDVIRLGRTILHERASREREYEHGRG